VNHDGDLTRQMLPAIETELRLTLDSFPATWYGGLVQMITYHLGWDTDGPAARGKRVRPLLTLLIAAAAGGDWRQALPAAAAVELIHNFSLVHDDIQDRSDTRRGRPTVWKQWGIAQAINTGDALFVAAHQAASRLATRSVEPRAVLAVRDRLDHACLRLTQGQHLDLAFEQSPDVTQPAYLEMIAGKTAALLEAATAAGALVAGASEPQVGRYAEFGLHLGLAFQILDDLLGIWGEPAITGKPSGDDLAQRKKTLPILMGLSTSPEFARLWASGDSSNLGLSRMREALQAAGVRDSTRQAAQAHTRQALEALDAAQPVAPAASELRALADILLQRSH
jgi:geranylgeranyl diphosphate synthase, type I